MGMKKYYTLKEITDLTNKSQSSIYRWYDKIKDNKDLQKYIIIENIKGRDVLKVDIKLIEQYYPNVFHSQNKNNEDETSSKQDDNNENEVVLVHGLLERHREYNVLLKNSQNTINELQKTIQLLSEKQKGSFFGATFFTIVGFIIIIAVLGVLGHFYITEKENIYSEKLQTEQTLLNNKIISYENKVKTLVTQINDMKKDYFETTNELKTLNAEKEELYKNQIERLENEKLRMDLAIARLNEELMLNKKNEVQKFERTKLSEMLDSVEKKYKADTFIPPRKTNQYKPTYNLK